MTAEIVTLNDISLRDIPGRLRQMADRIEIGEYGDPRFAIVVLVDMDNSQRQYGYGDVSLYEAVGALSWASSHFGDDK